MVLDCVCFFFRFFKEMNWTLWLASDGSRWCQIDWRQRSCVSYCKSWRPNLAICILEVVNLDGVNRERHKICYVDSAGLERAWHYAKKAGPLSWTNDIERSMAVKRKEKSVSRCVWLCSVHGPSVFAGRIWHGASQETTIVSLATTYRTWLLLTGV